MARPVIVDTENDSHYHLRMSKKKAPVKNASGEEKAKPPAAPVGRPSKYKPEYCEQLVEHMKQGNSFYTFGVKCDPPVCWDTLKEWANVYQEFSAAKKLGRQYEMLWWDNLHRRCATTGEGNITAIVWAQKNKFTAHFKERVASGKQQIQLNANMDVKQLVANMPPEQLGQLILAIEAKTQMLEEAKE